MKSISEDLIIDIRKLLDIEKEYNKYVYETKGPETKQEIEVYLKNIMSKAKDAYTLRHKILLNSEEIDIIQIRDNGVKEILSKIRENKDKFYSVSAHIQFSGLLNGNRDDNKKISTDLSDQLLSDDDLLLKFHGSFSYIDYYIRRIKVGPIIYTSYLPIALKQYFSEVRQAYAFGLYRSSIIMCRSVLEISLYDKLKRKKLISNITSNVTDMKKYFDDKLFELIKITKNNNIINKHLSDRCHEIREIANKVLHLKEDEIKVAEDDVLKMIKDTLEIVEYLYK
ncbi:MAG: hypothetical protein BWY26_01232 [Elusimicrobia bacterium ADurb.Bin231]|jgi:hypothetical protein|nr:MAG: hypothetical protein BWY26_01232 [Elusimicrobia bacterium ADurb.Bin231]HPD57535.1 DUF4145 domain-containing protein [Smithellaceae bacterium]HPM09127.1 DUF4145 domain-containing protein [Paludibacter sp.]HPY04135.1 DUF4145 domain-containing protein [Spirochaetota bacterium]